MPETSPRVFTKETLVKGRPAQIECVTVSGQTYSVSRGPFTIVQLEDEWYDDVRDPAAIMDALRTSREVRPDIFTFWQRPPDLAIKYPFHHEWEEIAVLPVKSHQFWWDRQIKSRVRNLIRRSEKDGVVVRRVPYDDDFVRGMTRIFNEAPVRQGRPFWHYGKDVDTVRRQFSRYVHREHMIGAFLGEEMVGFVMLGNAGAFGITGQIISSLEHRDKFVSHALIGKSVELCEELGLQYLVYFFWTDDSLGEFKRRCGFERTLVPRYFVPLSIKGTLAVRARLHRGWREMLPPRARASLKHVRSAWYAWQERKGSAAGA